MVSFRASPQGLEIIDQARIRRGWSRQAVAWTDAALTSIATLKRFWRQEPIQSETFIRICRAVGIAQWEEIVAGAVALNPPIQSNFVKDWGEAPDVSVFYNRQEELHTLEQWVVHDRCRLVALVGIAGIGKTALAVRLAEQIQGEFKYLIWRSLRHAPPLKLLLADLLTVLPAQPETEPGLTRLLDCFKKHRCLLVLDETEMILSGGRLVGQYRQGYEDYRELLRRIGEERHQSCLILTSREQPTAPRDSMPSLQLQGLGEAAAEFFREKNLLDEADQWQKLIQIYGGNPLALKVVSTMIQEIFGGSTTEFLRQSTIILGDEMRELLDQQIGRLSNPEKIIMSQLAAHSHPLKISELAEKNSLINARSDLIEALSSLKRRSLIELVETETAEVLFTLQPVVRKYLLKQQH